MVKRLTLAILVLAGLTLAWHADVGGLLLSALAWEFGFHG